MALLFAALTFVTILLIFAAIAVFTAGPEEAEIIKGRLEAIDKGSSLAKKALDLGLIRDELLSSIPSMNKLLVRWSWPGRLRNFISQAGMRVRPGKLILISAVTGLATFEVVEMVYRMFWLSVLAGVVASLIPLAFIAIKRVRRLRAFAKQFPEVIDLLSRSVRAGHALTTGLELVSSDLPEPAATEFRTTFDEQRYGLPLRDALVGLCDRVPLVDVRLFVVALLVQKETGGNLAEILDKLAHTMRERFRIAGEVRVRTAQGRLTALILISLPLITLLMLRSIDPGYINTLFLDRWGQLLLGGAFLLQLLGGFVIWRIVQVKV
jgi:tight adherence protein B